MIWLPRADQPLVFANPSSLSFGYLRRGRARSLRVRLTDAGGGAGAWQVSVRRLATERGATLSAPTSATVPGRVSLRATASRRAAAGDSSGFLVLRRGSDVRRIPYWLHVTARALAREPSRLLRGPGLYRRRHPAREGARLVVPIPEQARRAGSAGAPHRPGAGLPVRAPEAGRQRRRGPRSGTRAASASRRGSSGTATRTGSPAIPGFRSGSTRTRGASSAPRRPSASSARTPAPTTSSSTLRAAARRARSRSASG